MNTFTELNSINVRDLEPSQAVNGLDQQARGPAFALLAPHDERRADGQQSHAEIGDELPDDRRPIRPPAFRPQNAALNIEMG